MSILGYDTFFGGMSDSFYDDEDANRSVLSPVFHYVDQDAHVAITKNKNSYLVLVGNDINKYCFLYQPESYGCRYFTILVLSIPLEVFDELFLNTLSSVCIFITLLLASVHVFTYRQLLIPMSWLEESRMIFKQGMFRIDGMLSK